MIILISTKDESTFLYDDSITNFRDEFLEHTKDKPRVIAVELIKGEDNIPDLRVGHTQEEYEMFLEGINFNYDRDKWSHILYGIIWYEDGTWSERLENEDSEWWEYRKCPDIPEGLREDGGYILNRKKQIKKQEE